VALVIVVVVVATVVWALVPTGEPQALAERSSDGTVVERIEVSEVFDTDAEPLPRLMSVEDDPAIGMLAPVVSGVDPDGEPMTVPGPGPAVIVTLAHWCPHCQREVPILVRLQESGRWPSGVALYAISSFVDESRGNYPPSEWLEREGWTAPILVDTEYREAVAMYGITSTPGMVWIDAAGTVVLRTSGTIPASTMEVLLGQLAAGQRPDATLVR
jgi:thiol-disulfide isomerase/thioredoxin